MNTLDLRAERLASELERVNQMRDLMHRFGAADEWETGAIIRFDKVLGANRQKYSYCAMLAPDGYWYTTGPANGNIPRTWAELTVWMLNGTPVEQVWIVTAMEAML